jgi:Type II secretion system (T2SS), protein E, N-terminal domain
LADIVGPLLVRAGLITQEQLVAAHQARRQSGGTLTEHLVQRGALNEEALCGFYRQRLLVPQVSWAELGKVTPSVIARIPAEIAGEFRVIPMAIDREQNLTVAMADPSDTHAIDEIGFFTGSFVMRAVAAPTAVAWALYHYYGITTMLLPKLAAKPGAGPRAHSVAATTLVSDELPAVRPPPPLPLPAPAPEVPLQVRDTPSGAAVVVDRPRKDAPSEAKVIVALEGESSKPFKRKPPALIVEDEYGEDTPLPEPVPLGITGPIVRTELAAPEPPPPPAPSAEALAALHAAVDALHVAPDRDAVAVALVNYLARMFKRAAFFVVRKGELAGWLGYGGGLHPSELRRAVLKLDKPSTFREILQARLPFRGPIGDATSRDFLIDALGWAPETVLVVPLMLRDRVVGLLYGDDQKEPVPEDHVAELERAGSAALEAILAAKKGL